MHAERLSLPGNKYGNSTLLQWRKKLKGALKCVVVVSPWDALGLSQREVCLACLPFCSVHLRCSINFPFFSLLRPESGHVFHSISSRPHLSQVTEVILLRGANLCVSNLIDSKKHWLYLCGINIFRVLIFSDLEDFPWSSLVLFCGLNSEKTAYVIFLRKCESSCPAKICFRKI